MSADVLRKTHRQQNTKRWSVLEEVKEVGAGNSDSATSVYETVSIEGLHASQDYCCSVFKQIV